MEVCPVNSICFDKNTFLLLIVGGIVFVSHYIGKTNDKIDSLKHEIRDNKNKYDEKIHNYTLTLSDNKETATNVFRDRLDNALQPPARSSPYTMPTVPINIPTRGEASGYQQVGLLIQSDGEGNNQVKLPLFGQQIYPRSREWNYYTNSDGYQSVKLGINSQGRNSMDRHGIPELYDGNSVSIDGYDSQFNVKLYKLDNPRYIPNVI